MTAIVTDETRLPRGWEWRSLDSLGRYHNGRGFKKEEWSETGRPIIRIQNLTDPTKPFNYYQGEAAERHTVRRGDLLISWAATLDAFIWDGEEAILNQHIFKVDSTIDPKLHYWLIKGALEQLRARAHGTGMVHITRRPFLETQVPLPPPAERGRLAERLDSLNDDIESGQSILRAASLQVGRLFDATVEEEVQRLIQRQCPGKSAMELAADVPYSLAIGPFGSNLKVSDYQPSGVPLVFVRNIRSRDFGPENAKYVSQTKARELRAHQIEGGDLLITKMGDPPGDAAIYPTDAPQAVITADCIRFVLNTDLACREYIAALFRSLPVRRQIRDRTQGVAQKKISLKTFKTVEFIIPPLDEQDRIVARLQAVEASSRQLAQPLDAISARSEALRKRVLLSAMNGVLV